MRLSGIKVQVTSRLLQCSKSKWTAPTPRMVNVLAQNSELIEIVEQKKSPVRS